MNDEIPVKEEAIVAGGEPEQRPSPPVAHGEWEMGEIVIVLLFALPVVACVLLIIFFTLLT